MAKQQAQSATEKPAPKRRTSKAAADGEAPATETVGTNGKGAPRPRKLNYGIVAEHKVQVKDKDAEPKLKAGEAEGYAMAQKGCTVEAFLKGSDRSTLRRLSRKGLINIIGTDGTVYPIDYVAPEKPAKKEKPEAGEPKAA